MKKWNWNNIRLVLLIGVMLFLYGFSSERNKNRIVSKPEIIFKGESTLFLTEEVVNNLLIEKLRGKKTFVKENLVLKKLEGVLRDNGMVENAEVYVTTDGKLKVEIIQKTPVVRVFDGKESYYIDCQGSKMPLSENFSARVPLVLADINSENKAGLVSFFCYIYKDSFLSKNIISIDAVNLQNIILKNRDDDFIISLGGLDHFDRKLNNYKAFYQKAVQDTLISQYKDINLKFLKQVVCTKK